MTIYYPIPFIDEAYTFTDEKIITTNGDETVTMSAADKWQVLHDWRQFLLNGFKKLFFTPTIHRYLVTYCGFGGYNREQFWLTHCGCNWKHSFAAVARLCFQFVVAKLYFQIFFESTISPRPYSHRSKSRTASRHAR